MKEQHWIKILGTNEWHYAPLDSPHTNADVTVACGIRVNYGAIHLVHGKKPTDPKDEPCPKCVLVAPDEGEA